ncbi:hypothetical protein PRK78_003266 [Emydomyces testavorans]|uniref:Cytochrome P450 n=1 Tax=Emydomyces testavorans TaxID=2070801 RepID=A0AAF0DGL3_9EURO|nr:hypothetical protein PRK78_003266 [Emydomyces testavorans]
MLTNEKSRKVYKELLVTVADVLSSPFATFLGWFPHLVVPIQKLFGPDNIGEFGMKQVEAALIDSSEVNKAPTTHLQHLVSIFKKDGPSTILPDKSFIASDCLDHFVAGKYTLLGPVFLFHSPLLIRKGSFTLADLFSALLWELSLPENKPRQSKLRQELHGAGILPETHPDLLVVQKLPYLNCILREVLRVHQPVPFGLPRKVKKGQNVVVLGMKIPAGVSFQVTDSKDELEP